MGPVDVVTTKVYIGESLDDRAVRTCMRLPPKAGLRVWPLHDWSGNCRGFIALERACYSTRLCARRHGVHEQRARDVPSEELMNEEAFMRLVNSVLAPLDLKLTSVELEEAT